MFCRGGKRCAPDMMAAIRQLPTRVNIRLSSIRRGPRPGGAIRPDRNPEGHLIVAHYAVVGHVFSKATRPARDDRLAACAREAVCEPRTEGSIVPYRDGAIFNAFSHHFVVGYYQMSLWD
jgi:hypothetical protein